MIENLYILKDKTKTRLFRNTESLNKFLVNNTDLVYNNIDLKGEVKMVTNLSENVSLEVISKSKIIDLYNSGEKIERIAERSGLSKTSICNILNKNKELTKKENRVFTKVKPSLYKTDQQLSEMIQTVRNENPKITLSEITKRTNSNFTRVKKLIQTTAV